MSNPNQLGLGQIITTEQSKDAIHVAVAPVESDELLKPGVHVRLTASGKAVETNRASAIGVVDPFLNARVQKGERFWLFLYPGTITSLRHDWSHPAFEGTPEPTQAKLDDNVSKSRKWLEAFAADFGADVDALINAANTGNASRVCGSKRSFNEQAHEPEFWEHIETVTGQRFGSEHREKICFSCIC